MSDTKPIQFRLPPETREQLGALAASNGGNATTALKECAAQWLAAVAEAGAANARDLSEEDWVRLAHLNDPDPFGDIEGIDTDHGRDWSQALALELATVFDGRPVVLPGQKAEEAAYRELAARVGALGRVRGYALMSALRYFWREPSAGIAACVEPAVWLTPTAKE